MSTYKFNHNQKKIEAIMALPDDMLVPRSHIAEALGMGVSTGQIAKEFLVSHGVTRPAQTVSRIAFYYARDAKRFIQRRINIEAETIAKLQSQRTTPPQEGKVFELERRVMELEAKMLFLCSELGIKREQTA